MLLSYDRDAMAVLPFLILMIVALAGVVGVVVRSIARMLLRPPRMTAGKAMYVLNRIDPADLQLEFVDMTFDVRDEHGKPLRIAAWWMPANTSSTVVLIHGYADAKVGAIAFAPLFRELGFNVLALDLRGHGQSGGERTSAGCFERDDVSQVVDQLRAIHPSQTQRLVLFGISMGSAVACAVAKDRDDVSAVVCESPYVDFQAASRTHAHLLGLPLPELQGWSVRLAQWMLGCDFETAAPRITLPKIACPVMLIMGEQDPFVPPGEVEKLREIMVARGNARDAVCVFKEGSHVTSYHSDPAGYRSALERFLVLSHH